MDSVAIRTCEREGCERDLDALGLKATARFCGSTCQRKHSRQHGDGDPARKWIKGYWRSAQPRRRPPVRRAGGTRHHSLGISSKTQGFPAPHSAAQRAS